MNTPQEKAWGGAGAQEKPNTDFCVLDKFPEEVRPFYTLEDPENPAVTNDYDFFMRGQVILSGGQRIHVPELLEARIRKKGIDPQSPGSQEYADKIKSPPGSATARRRRDWTGPSRSLVSGPAQRSSGKLLPQNAEEQFGALAASVSYELRLTIASSRPTKRSE